MGRRIHAGRTSGSLLVAAVVAVAVMAALLAVAYVAVRQRTVQARARLDAATLESSAAEIVRVGMARLADDPDRAIDSLHDPWAQPAEFELPNGVAVALAIDDEQRRFDLNNLAATPGPGRSPREIADDLFTLCGDLVPARRLDALEAWMRGEGAATPGLRLEAEAAYASPGGRLHAWPELLMAPGMDLDYLLDLTQGSGQETFRGRLLDHLALLPVDRAQPIPVNLNTAGRHVLLAVLGIGEEPLVERILTTRRQVPLPSVALAIGEREDLQPVAERYLAVRSRYFTIRARAFLAGQAHQVEALVAREDDGEVRVVRWQEGRVP